MQISPAKILYRGLLVFAVFAAVFCFATPAFGQEDRPIIPPTDRRAPKKKDSSPRAVAVLQMTASGKTSLVPIAILVNGKFWDATAYKADPVPMALESGTVYEAERSGSSLGLFTVAGALRSKAVNSATPWLGIGTWHPGGADTSATEARTDNAPVGIDTSDQPPRLTKNPNAAQPAPGTAPASTPPASSPQSPPQSPDSDAPPRLTKPGPPPSSTPSESSSSQTSSTAPPATSTPSPAGSSPPQTKPTDMKPAETKPVEAPAPPASDSGASESSRPRLRRVKPVGPPPDEDFPGYSRPGAASSTAKASDKNSAPADKASADQNRIIDTVPAISDASGPEPHSYAFQWLKDEEGDRRKQMLDLAKTQFLAYLDARTKAAITPTPPPKAATRHVTAPKSKPAEPIFENVQMHAYDVWNTNVPVIVLSAEAHMPPSTSGSTQPALNPDLHYSILLVAYPDIYQNLHKLYSSVTDRYHLDLTPRLDLVDAVDADGDARGELLFRETSDAGTGWVIYRPTADKLWKLYDSLNPE